MESENQWCIVIHPMPPDKHDLNEVFVTPVDRLSTAEHGQYCCKAIRPTECTGARQRKHDWRSDKHYPDTECRREITNSCVPMPNHARDVVLVSPNLPPNLQSSAQPYLRPILTRITTIQPPSTSPGPANPRLPTTSCE